MKKFIAVVLLFSVLAVVAAQCGAAPTPETIVETVVETVVVEKEGEKVVETVVVEKEVEKIVVATAVPEEEEPVTIKFWTAPNPQQEAYWKDVVDNWNASHPDIQVDWEVIPAGGSSEEVLLTAIATGTAPDISTNIFSGFAAQLVSSGAAVALDEMPGFEEVVEARQMGNILEKGWGYQGHYYVLPIYNNAMTYWWGKDLLEEAGMSEAPRTYSDVLALCEVATQSDDLRYGILYPSYKNWWDRWFGYLTLYYAASGGAPYIDLDANEVVFDNESGMKVLEFMDETFRTGCAPTEDLTDPLQTGLVGGQVMGPWSIIPVSETYPDFEYVVAPPPVPDDFPEGDPVYTFADTKGMVMFSQSENKEAAWEFIKWYFSDIQHDVDWLEATNLPPVREDITTNPAFDDYWANNPVVKKYAEGVPYSVPPALIPATIEVQRIMGREMIEPIWFGTKPPDEAMGDAVVAIEDYLTLGQ